MRPVAVASLAVAIAAAACEVDFVEIGGPPQPGFPAAFQLTLTFDDRATDSLFFSGDLRPGADTAGAARVIESDTLWIAGVPHTPERAGPGWRYVGRIPVPGPVTGARVFEIRLPRVRDVAPAVDRLTIEAVRAAGPDTIRLVRGRDLDIEVYPPRPYPGPGVSATDWRFQVSALAAFLSLQGGRPVPARLTVPANWFTADSTTTYFAHLYSRAFIRPDASDVTASDYRVFISTTTFDSWVVLVVDSVSAAAW